MERLTQFHDGIWGLSIEATKAGYDIYSVFSRLAAYEDAGLEPEEIKKVQEALDTIPFGRFYEIMQAERDGRCIVPPCKVGDTMYFTGRGYVEETKVRTFFAGHPSYCRGEPDPRCYMIRCTNLDVPMKDFGKTLFPTREAAEAALKERE